jgi:hypothetical protein
VNKPVGLLVIPSRLIARNLLCSDFLSSPQMTALRWVVITTDPKDGELLSKSGYAQWREYFHPVRNNPGRGGWRIRWDQLRYYFGLFLHMHLVHRFNVIAGFVGFGMKLKQSWILRRQYLREGQPMSALFGFPFPTSNFLYSSLHKCYYRGWQRYNGIEKIFDDLKPDFVVIAQLQTHVVTPYVLAARSCDTPIFGLNGSWDQPTTKGPLFPWLRKVFVQNELVKEELVRFHDFRPENVIVIGWLQMDSYPEARRAPVSRENFLPGLGVAESSKVILFALNTPRLGRHERQIARALYRRIIEDEFGQQAILVLRCHPLDIAWQERWSEFLDSPRVIVDFPNVQSFEQLAASILYSEVIISSAGSFYLDSLALEKPTIGLAWEDKSLSFFDRPARAYEMEHLKPMREIGGSLVKDESELVNVLHQIFLGRDVQQLKEGRRERFFHELDGRSVERLAIGLAEQVKTVSKRKNRKRRI